MPAQITNYQCPACTGPLHFVGESGKLECDYCGSSYEAAEIQALYAEKEEKAAAAQQAAEEAKKDHGTSPIDGGVWDTSGFCQDWGAEGKGMRAYSCPSCGEELVSIVAQMAPSRVVYVSCDPATLARDLARFRADGTFRVVSATPVDLFPQTFHCETVVHLTRS